MKKKIFMLLLAVVIGSSFSLIGRGKKGDDKKITITFVTPLIAHPVWLKAKEGLEQAGKDLGIKVNWVGPQGLDVSEMINQVETAIVEKVDGIITMGLNPQAMGPVLRKAAKAGIPVVLVDGDVTDAPRLAFLGLSPEQVGELGANAILDKVGRNKALVGAAMVPNIEHPIANGIIKSYEKNLKAGAKSFRHTTTAESKSDMLKAISRWEEIFTTYPDINVLYCTGAETGPAAAKVIEEKGLKGKVTVVAIDDIDETLDAIRKGNIYATMAVNFFRYGYESVQILYDYIESGKKPAEIVNAVPPVLVTAKNVDSYAKDMRNPESW